MFSKTSFLVGYRWAKLMVPWPSVEQCTRKEGSGCKNYEKQSNKHLSTIVTSLDFKVWASVSLKASSPDFPLSFPSHRPCVAETTPRKNMICFFHKTSPISPNKLKIWRLSFKNPPPLPTGISVANLLFNKRLAQEDVRGLPKQKKHHDHPLLFSLKMNAFLKTSSVKFFPGPFLYKPLVAKGTLPTACLFRLRKMSPKKTSHVYECSRANCLFPHKSCRLLVEWCTNRSMGLQKLSFFKPLSL